MKYIICRPRGGINDSLCQIEKCWCYAKESGRTLIIDTDKAGCFHLPFGRFFQVADPGETTVLHPSTSLFEKLEMLSVIPKCIFGRINSYTPVYNHTIMKFIDKDTEEQLSFDFTKSYSEDVLLHDQCGGNKTSLNCLARLKMTSEFRHSVTETLSFIGDLPYYAIAIRHGTDYQTDYKAEFERVYKEVKNKRLLVCSDNSEVIDYAHSFFSETTLLTFPSLDINKENIPYVDAIKNLDEHSKYKLIVKAFADLIALSASSKFYTTRLTGGGVGGYSGFVLLAENLFKNYSVVSQLMAE